MTTARLKLPEIDTAQAGKDTTHNEALRMLDLFAGGALKSITLTAPPGSPAEGDGYYVPAAATGDWQYLQDKLAHWINSQWYYYEVPDYWAVYIDDAAAVYLYNGTSWSESSSSLAGKAYADISSGDVTLTQQQARSQVIQIGGSYGSAVTVTFPANEQLWIVGNDSDQAVILSTGAGGTIYLESGYQFMVWGDGTGIRAAITIAPDGLKMGRAFTPPIYNTASAPAASGLYGALIFVTDGDTGAPCLAVSDGGAWKRVPLGATIAAS